MVQPKWANSEPTARPYRSWFSARAGNAIEVPAEVPAAFAAGGVDRQSSIFFGAGHETRTRDPELGKLVLYQLS